LRRCGCRPDAFGKIPGAERGIVDGNARRFDLAIEVLARLTALKAGGYAWGSGGCEGGNTLVRHHQRRAIARRQGALF
jgi:hypothetical protein